MPELPEVETTARRLDEALRGAEIVSALAPGVKAMRTFDPPLSALEGQRIERVGRRGKHFGHEPPLLHPVARAAHEPVGHVRCARVAGGPLAGQG